MQNHDAKQLSSVHEHAATLALGTSCLASNTACCACASSSGHSDWGSSCRFLVAIPDLLPGDLDLGNEVHLPEHACTVQWQVGLVEVREANQIDKSQNAAHHIQKRARRAASNFQSSPATSRAKPTYVKARKVAPVRLRHQNPCRPRALQPGRYMLLLFPVQMPASAAALGLRESSCLVHCVLWVSKTSPCKAKCLSGNRQWHSGVNSSPWRTWRIGSASTSGSDSRMRYMGPYRLQ